MDRAYKCIGVWHNEYRLYFDGKHEEFFVLTPNYRITQSPRRVCDELADWCKNQIEKFLEKEKPVDNIDEECTKCKRYHSKSCSGVSDRGRSVENFDPCGGYLSIDEEYS